MEDKFRMDEKLAALERVKVNLPLIVGNSCQLFFDREFATEKWNNQLWAPRKNPNDTHHLLVKTGALRSALNTSLKQANWDKVAFRIDIPYAAVHNYGLQAGRGNGFQMPQRKFMGDSQELRNILKEKILSQLRTIFK